MDLGFYTKPEKGGEFIIGGFGRKKVTSPDQRIDQVDSDDLSSLSSTLNKRLPKFADSKVKNTWTGLITDTPDGHQIIGRNKNVANFYNVVAGNGHGFKEAPGFAESVALDILREEPKFSLASYNLERFERGEEFTNLYSEDWLG